MSYEMTPAEQAAAEALEREYLDGAFDPAADDIDEGIGLAARAVVAAVRPIVAAETLRAEADNLEGAVPSEDAMPMMFSVPAHIWLRDQADSRLRAAERQAEGSGTDA